MSESSEIKPEISYVILTWNSAAYIGKCLDSILECGKNPSEIIVVDNGSQDGTPEILKQYCNRHQTIRSIFLEKNYGTTISRNKGIRAANSQSRYICILDSDTIMNQGAINGMQRVLNESPRNALCGPVMYDLDGELQITAKKIPTAVLKICKGFPNRKIQEKGLAMERYIFDGSQSDYPVGYLISACWMVRREVFKQVGLLDEHIFYSPEDVEFCARLWQNGYRVLYCTEGSIIHAVQRISKRKLFSKHNWEHVKGLLYFFRKYHLFFNADRIKCK